MALLRYATPLLVTALGSALVTAPLAHADSSPITIVVPGERPVNTKIALGGLLVGGALFTGLGVYFHLDSRDSASGVASDTFTGEAWSTEKQALLDDANSSRKLAIGGYAIGGALLVGAIVMWIVSEPESETIVIHPRGAQPMVSPTQGGAVLGGTWSF